jgi:hypothetical protein
VDPRFIQTRLLNLNADVETSVIVCNRLHLDFSLESASLLLMNRLVDWEDSLHPVSGLYERGCAHPLRWAHFYFEPSNQIINCCCNFNIQTPVCLEAVEVLIHGQEIKV